MANYRIAGNTGEWEIVCGLEVHAQIISNAKLLGWRSFPVRAEG